MGGEAGCECKCVWGRMVRRGWASVGRVGGQGDGSGNETVRNGRGEIMEKIEVWNLCALAMFVQMWQCRQAGGRGGGVGEVVTGRWRGKRWRGKGVRGREGGGRRNGADEGLRTSERVDSGGGYCFFLFF